ncbi:hypothetical protein [Pedobacter psychroterrae]|uniref:Uncharacterized protein n=1 Tax=Pedobacter psychroterrae TaxID=2530453 RepID=A0A4R0NHB0_9SPHI|nr:hypothetical protein [Pedobacter psychroterrae]TCC99989.1 hypothetical protein EZ437_17270 [Pedobacter psychroterrae]
MKKLFSGLNKAGLLAILFAAGVITTQSAFTPALLNTYYFDGTNWKVLTRTFDNTVDPVTGQYDPNSYQCTLSENICTAQIESEESTIPGSQNPELFNETDGTYVQNP